MLHLTTARVIQNSFARTLLLPKKKLQAYRMKLEHWN
jgi:hypothetical protein